MILSLDCHIIIGVGAVIISNANSNLRSHRYRAQKSIQVSGICQQVHRMDTRKNKGCLSS